MANKSLQMLGRYWNTTYLSSGFSVNSSLLQIILQKKHYNYDRTKHDIKYDLDSSIIKGS